jgi:oligopeptide/dipeptide ABC transporter ATP-binding protein
VSNSTRNSANSSVRSSEVDSTADVNRPLKHDAPLIELRNLTTHYVSAGGARVVRAVEDVSFTVRAGETLGIVGESGSGKSTLALTMMRVLPPAARIVGGQMLLEGEDLVQKSEDEMRHIRGKRIAMILQDPMASLNPLFTIGNQVGEPLRVHEGLGRNKAWRRAIELLKSVRIPAPETRVTQHPHEMSGGMRQRIVGAIGISCDPRVLIADEPTTSLDLTIQAQYLSLLADLQKEHRLGLIFITHNLGIVAKMCDQLVVMYAGKVVESGPVMQVFDAPAHPYTSALLNSIPRMSRQRERLTAIEGQPPDLSALPKGCSFAARCPAAFDRCLQEAPPAFEPGPGRTSRCWLAAKHVVAHAENVSVGAV